MVSQLVDGLKGMPGLWNGENWTLEWGELLPAQPVCSIQGFLQSSTALNWARKCSMKLAIPLGRQFVYLVFLKEFNK